MKDYTKADDLQRKLWGACLIAAPLLLAASTPLRFNSETLFGAALIQMFAFALFIPAVLGIAHLLWERSPHLAVFGGALAIFGCVGGINYSTTILYQWVAGVEGVGKTSIATINDTIEGHLWSALSLPGLTFPLMLLVLSIGLFWTNVVPRWGAVLLGLGAIAFPIGRAPDIQLFYHLSDLLLLISLGWIGLRYMTQPKTHQVIVSPTVATS